MFESLLTWFQSAFWFLFQPWSLIALIFLLVIVYSLVIGKVRLAYTAIGLALYSWGTDLIFPPYSACTTALAGNELIAKSLQNIPLSDDIWACSIAKLHINFNIFDFPLKQSFQLNLIIFPLLLGFFILVALLALRVRKFTVSLPAVGPIIVDMFELFIGFVGFVVPTILSVDGIMIDSVRLTFIGVLMFSVIPLTLILIGSQMALHGLQGRA